MKSFIRPSLAVLILATSLAHAGTIDPSQEKFIATYKSQPNPPKPEEMLINTDAEPALTDGFKDLFNGKDLTGWSPKGGKCTYEVKDGCIVGTCVKGSPSTYLCTDKDDYKDFIFTCEMKWEQDGNSGVMFRSLVKTKADGGSDVAGPQVEMEGFEKNRGWSGGIYGQNCGGWWYPLWLKEHSAVRVALKENEWNRVTIQAKGNVIKTWLNGVPAAHWTNDTYPKGVFGLQIHQGNSGKVLWRGVKLKES
jgi:hypothetical protein